MGFFFVYKSREIKDKITGSSLERKLTIVVMDTVEVKVYVYNLQP